MTQAARPDTVLADFACWPISRVSRSRTAATRRGSSGWGTASGPSFRIRCGSPTRLRTSRRRRPASALGW
jgi:hypothetical protein